MFEDTNAFRAQASVWSGGAVHLRVYKNLGLDVDHLPHMYKSSGSIFGTSQKKKKSQFSRV